MKTELNIQAIGEKVQKVIADVNVLIVDAAALVDEFKSKTTPAPNADPKLVTEAASLPVRVSECCDDLAELQARGVEEIDTPAGKIGLKSLIAILQNLGPAIEQLQKLIETFGGLIAK